MLLCIFTEFQFYSNATPFKSHKIILAGGKQAVHSDTSLI